MDDKLNQPELTDEEVGILLQMTPRGTNICDIPRQHQEDMIEAYRRGIFDPADDSPTDKQERFMKRHGLWRIGDYTKEEASQIIGDFIAKERYERTMNRVP